MKRVDVLHPGPFVAAQASALWFPLTHCLATALSGALTILPALLAVLSTADISLRLLLVSLLLAASRPKRSWPGGSAGASRMCDSCSRRCSTRCSTRAASTCESGRIVKLKGLVSASPLSASCSVSWVSFNGVASPSPPPEPPPPLLIGARRTRVECTTSFATGDRSRS